ncbi:Hpt domain-containing protein [Pseudomaricurvus alkylphenolicus]|jgi:HPt (histidine-containing phosphotransfer) domain-containing protein|uniref:Hpt domain-containing protein n=1 Tax=Pseudomaricurvus alkylphenolicus TaxID=1306991 RepID=UPI00141F01BB|nr:Hpt domain-containing protein [Pseudomaricurvus alkylphenolicus]NIB43202.1 Hpt domain-containing protein [Pseudomaricurvus alkylphenolicus]
MTQSVDTETLAMLKEVMEDDFNNLINTFLDDARQRLPLLREQLAASDYEALRRTAHSLKGSSSNLGAMPLSELCFQVEHRANEHQLSGVEGILQEIDAEFQQVSDILSQF